MPRVRYVTLRFSNDLGEECPDIGMAHTVYEADDGPRKTGLLDSSGAPLYAILEREPIGFIRRREEN